MSDVTFRRRESERAARPLHAEVDARFPNLPRAVRAWLAEHPEAFGLLMQIEKYVANDELSSRDVLRLAKRWQGKLPARRGEVVKLSDFMQTEFELGLPRRRAKGTRSKAIQRRKKRS